MTQAIKSSQTNLLAHSIFRKISSGDISTNQLRIFAEQYYLASVAFPAFLASAVAKIEDEMTRLSLVGNLWDEYGRGDPARFHRTMLARFVTACGSDLSTTFAPLPSTSLYISGMSVLCGSTDAGEILGAIGPGCEDVTPAEYQLLYDGFRITNRFAKDDLEFFADHIRHDAHHSDGIQSAIDGWVKKYGDSSVVHGALQALMLEDIFWTGILNAFEEAEK